MSFTNRSSIMQDFEKLGVFYLGKVVDSSTGQVEDNLLLYDSKDLTTHAVCVGMTGSGKTGLGIGILEEAAIDKIPAIIIDPKGDMGNLLLTFPELSAEAFKPWIDKAEADRKGMSLDSYADKMAKTWESGLATWGEDRNRIARFRDSVELAIYTPASLAGIPISILNSFAAPPKEQMLDTAAIREKIQSLTSSLLGLLGIAADPIKSREHILISTIIDQAWQAGKNLDIASLIQQVQKPPFTKIGALDIDTFYPPKDRVDLSISLNNLLASPGFRAWMDGVPLDIKELLYTKSGKPKLSVISIAHLTDAERMFFVTLLLNEFLTWMRRQPGTSSLRALLYMDEIFGFFPPTAMPPSKLPMLTLLKQARAYGIGIVLVTQNPVDLDYKGLSNCGTWFIGKLQTERDKARVIEGLKVASNGEIDAKALDKMIALTGNRTFIMRSIYEKDPVLFQTRWTLSFLRGPLTLTQISTLTDKSSRSAYEESKSVIEEEESMLSSSEPAVPPGINVFFARLSQTKSPVTYEPRLAAIAKLHFVDSKNKIDLWENVCYALPTSDDGKNLLWDEGASMPDLKEYLEKSPMPESTFRELPAALMQEKNYLSFEKAFATLLYQNQTLTIYQSPDLNLTSKEGESEGDFRTRVSHALREKRDELVKKLREKYADKVETLTAKIKRAQDKMAQKQEKAGMQKIQTIISFGATILGAIFGRRVTRETISQTGTSLRRATQMGKDSQDVSQAENDLKTYQQQLQDLEDQMNNEVAAITSKSEDLKIETISIRPRKSDIDVEKMSLLWWPN